MTTPELPNAEGAIRGWLRSFVDITNLCGQRQFFGVPQQDNPGLPCIVLYRVGGSPDIYGKDYPQMVLEHWGATKFDASELARIVAARIAYSVWRPPVIVGGFVVESGEVNNGPRESGGVSWAKRYRLDATFTVRYA